MRLPKESWPYKDVRPAKAFAETRFLQEAGFLSAPGTHHLFLSLQLHLLRWFDSCSDTPTTLKHKSIWANLYGICCKVAPKLAILSDSRKSKSADPAEDITHSGLHECSAEFRAGFFVMEQDLAAISE